MYVSLGHNTHINWRLRRNTTDLRSSKVIADDVKHPKNDDAGNARAVCFYYCWLSEVLVAALLPLGIEDSPSSMALGALRCSRTICTCRFWCRIWRRCSALLGIDYAVSDSDSDFASIGLGDMIPPAPILLPGNREDTANSLPRPVAIGFQRSDGAPSANCCSIGIAACCNRSERCTCTFILPWVAWSARASSMPSECASGQTLQTARKPCASSERWVRLGSVRRVGPLTARLFAGSLLILRVSGHENLSRIPDPIRSRPHPSRCEHCARWQAWGGGLLCVPPSVLVLRHVSAALTAGCLAISR